MLTGHTWVAIQYRLAGFTEGQKVAIEYRWAGRQEHAAALRWKRDGHSITSSVRARKRGPNPSAEIVSVGFAVAPVGNVLLPTR
jgi:hypothetical protein